MRGRADGGNLAPLPFEQLKAFFVQVRDLVAGDRQGVDQVLKKQLLPPPNSITEICDGGDAY